MQIIADNMKQYIKDQLEEEGRCLFRFYWPDGYRCHFLVDPDCGHYGERKDIDTIPTRSEFYGCRLEE